MTSARFYFRVIEKGDLWVCRRGTRDLDWHASRDEAIAHIRLIAASTRPSEVMLHTLDGNVRSIVTYDSNEAPPRRVIRS